MATHEQVWVKVNAPVDVGIAEVVSLLNSVEGLLTLASCQGEAEQRDAYVYFSLGNWQTLCQFVFERIGTDLKQKFGEGVQAIVEAADADSPIAKLSFRAEIIGPLASALKDILR